MRQASWGGGKWRRAADRREPRGIEGGLAARAVERLMREIAQFIDEKTDLSHANQVIARGVPAEDAIGGLSIPSAMTHSSPFRFRR